MQVTKVVRVSRRVRSNHYSRGTPLAITLVTLVTPGTMEMYLGESTPFTTFNPETLVGMSLMQAPLLELSMQALLLELSQTMDQDLITILPEMSTNTLIRHEKSQTGSGRCMIEKSNLSVSIIFYY